MDIGIERTFDPFLVVKVMTHPEIWATVAEDNQSIAQYTPDVDADCWLTVTHGEYLIGLYKLQPLNSATLEIHCQILPEFREEHAKESSAAVLQWVLEHSPTKYQKVVAQIPVIYPNVIHFTKNAGFQEEGLNRQSYRKHGELHDQVYLGITRTEIESFLRGKI